jgi:hypothetical protein
MRIEDLKPGIQPGGWTAVELRLQLPDDIWVLLVKQIRKDTAQLAQDKGSVHVTSADIEKDPDFFITETYLKAFFSSH